MRAADGTPVGWRGAFFGRARRRWRDAAAPVDAYDRRASRAGLGGGTADRVRRRGSSGARHAHATRPPSFWEHGTGKDLRRRDQTPGKERGEAVAETGRRGMGAERGERGNDGGSAKGGMRNGSKAPAQSTGRQGKTERDGRGKRESGSPQTGETRNKEAMGRSHQRTTRGGSAAGKRPNAAPGQ